MSGRDRGTAMEWSHRDDLNEVVSQLQEGAEVYINDRSLSLEVFERGEERIGSDPHPTEVVYLEGRGGRVYRLRGYYLVQRTESRCRGGGCDVSKWGETPPRLELRREGEWAPSRTVTRIGLDDRQQIVSDTTSADIFGGDLS